MTTLRCAATGRPSRCAGWYFHSRSTATIGRCRPGGAGGSVAAVSRETAKRAKEDLLRKILGILDADGSDHPPKHALSVPRDEFVERVAISTASAEQELFVRAFFQALDRPRPFEFSARVSENPVENLWNERKNTGQSALCFGLHSFLC
jgi:hypothetical protein